MHFFRKEADNIAHVFDAIIRLKDQFSTQLKNVNASLSDFQKKSKYIAQDTKKLGKTMSKVGSTLNTHVTAPLTLLGGIALKASNDFGDAMAKVSTIADTTKVPIDTLKTGIIDLSNQTGISVNELAEAEYQALSASVDTAKVTDFLAVATKAAKGGFTDTATAVEGLTNVLNAYGYGAEKATEISNQMLVCQNLGKTTFGELAKSMGKVTPIASSLGVKTNELFSSLAVTTAQGLDTAESVTALKAAMSNIIKPSKEAGDAAEALGIDFSVSALQSKGWIGFMQDVKKGLEQASPEFASISARTTEVTNKMAKMEKAGKKNTKEYKNLKKETKNLQKELDMLAQMSDSPISAMAQMFGSVEGLNSVLMLTSDQGISKYNDSMKEMKDNTTAVTDAYDKMQTPAEKFRKNINKIKNSLLGLGSQLTPAMESVGSTIGFVADKISKLTPEQQQMIVKFAMLAAVVGPIASLIGRFSTNISGTISSINNLTTGIKKAGSAMKYFTSPGHLVVYVLMAIAVVTMLVITHWDTLSKTFKKHGKTIKTVAIIITTIFLPSLIKLGIQGTITSSKLSVGLIANIIKLGVQGTKTAAIFTGKLIVSIIKFAIEGWKSVACIAAQTAAWLVQKGIVVAHTVGIIAYKVAVLALNGATAVCTAAQWALNAAFLATPIGWICIGIAAVVAAVVGLHRAWVRDWNGIQEKTKSVIDKIKGYWNDLKTFLAHPIKGTISLIKHGDLSGVKGQNALGTPYWGGGLSLVGEFGPEIVELPAGSAVHDTKNSKKMLSSGSSSPTIIIQNMNVREESDIDKIATSLFSKLQLASLNRA